MTRRKRNVTLDTNVLIAYVISKRNNSLSKKVVMKSITDDRLMLTDIIMDECLSYARSPRAKVTTAEMKEKLKEISDHIIELKPIPSVKELAERYRIKDINDLKILYSVEMTDSVILVTYDDDFRHGVEGIKARIMHPKKYLNEGRGK